MKQYKLCLYLMLLQRRQSAEKRYFGTTTYNVNKTHRYETPVCYRYCAHISTIHVYQLFRTSVTLEITYPQVESQCKSTK